MVLSILGHGFNSRRFHQTQIKKNSPFYLIPVVAYYREHKQLIKSKSIELIKELATLSNGVVFPKSQPLKTRLRKLKILQRKLSSTFKSYTIMYPKPKKQYFTL